MFAQPLRFSINLQVAHQIHVPTANKSFHNMPSIRALRPYFLGTATIHQLTAIEGIRLCQTQVY